MILPRASVRFHHAVAALLVVGSLGALTSVLPSVRGEEGAKPEATKSDSKPDKEGWISLFDGKTLKGWKSTKFGGEGDVLIEEGQLILTQGNDMTGVTITRDDLPRSNYEIMLEARRVQGNDFFCGLTFPVKKDPCTLILGGWGGGVCGLSSIDGMDASENGTSSGQDFEKDKWYTVRLRVTDDRIVAWLNGKQLLEQELEGRRISIRSECDLSKPLGFATWRTTGALRNIRLKKIEPGANDKAAPKE